MKAFGRLLLMVFCAALLLQLFFVARIAVMAWIEPESTTYQRSEIWQLAHSDNGLRWQQQWVDYAQISNNLKRAVIASEDAGFMEHHGVQWDAIQKAYQRNAKAEAKAEQAEKEGNSGKPAKVYGGSTITQQLAKNLLLSPDKTPWRKAQEAVITLMIEATWSKRRIFEVYLNVIEWGNGVFGAEAAARHYFGIGAAQLAPEQAARLAGMVPSPRFYDRNRRAPGLANKAALILSRMPSARIP
jgi:monofunctional biosynthetic peptidoglycan transglycosylase